MVEQKLFEKSKETNCDIMFLVRRGEKIRLMSFKSNPWLKFDEPASDVDPDVYKQATAFTDHFPIPEDIPGLPRHRPGEYSPSYDRRSTRGYV